MLDPSSSDERAKLTVRFGVPAVSADLSLPLRIFAGAWRALRPTPLSNQVHVGADLAEVNVRSLDQGDIAVRLVACNFARREIAVEGVHVDWVHVGRGGLDLPQAHFLAHGMRLPARSASAVWFRIGIAPADIRSLRNWIPEAPNTRCSPGARVEMQGHLRLRAPKRDWRQEFGLSIQGVAWNVWLPEPKPDGLER